MRSLVGENWNALRILVLLGAGLSRTVLIVGDAVRGACLFSKSNETLAKFIETAIGVAARQAAKAAWKTITHACSIPARGRTRIALNFAGKDAK